MNADLDQPKQRLTSKSQILEALIGLSLSGIPAEKWLATLTRLFYVDLDAYNEAVNRGATDKSASR